MEMGGHELHREEKGGLKGRVLLLSNCPLDPTLGSGKTRLRWSEGLRKAGFSVQSIEPEKLTKGLPKSMGVRFRLAIGARQHSAIAGFDLVECFGAEFGLAQRDWFRRRSRPLIVAHTRRIGTSGSSLGKLAID